MVARLGLIAVISLFGSNAHAASQATVLEYAELAAIFDARQGKAARSTDTQLKLADCIVSGFESERGAGSIPQLMELMRTLARGVQFDDPLVVNFTENHGNAYENIIRRCENSI